MNKNRILGVPPSKRPERRKPDPRFLVVPGKVETPIVVGPARLEHLQGSFALIRATYWDGVVNGGFVDPFVFVIHNRSGYARRNNVQDGPIFQFHSVSRDAAVTMGLLQDGLVPPPVRPPIYQILLATADRIEYNVVAVAPPAALLDKLHFDPSLRAEIEAERPDVAALLREHPEYIERPWLLNDGVGFPQGTPPGQRPERRQGDGSETDAPTKVTNASAAPVRHDLYAEAVHRAVCEFDGSDGFGRCYLYTVAGQALLESRNPDGRTYYPQGGSLLLQGDPADPQAWFALLADDGGFERGEYHSWLAAPDGTMVDFVARHYARYVNGMMQHEEFIQDQAGTAFLLGKSSDRTSWRRPEPPTFIWSHHSKHPGWLKLRADRDTSKSLLARIQADKADMTPLLLLVLEHYDRLLAAANR